jgi:hypothetical protein
MTRGMLLASSILRRNSNILVEDYYAGELLKISLPAGLVDLHLSAALHPLKSKYDLISAYLHLGHPVDKFLSQDVLRKLFKCKNLTAE